MQLFPDPLLSCLPHTSALCMLLTNFLLSLSLSLPPCPGCLFLSLFPAGEPPPRPPQPLILLKSKWGHFPSCRVCCACPLCYLLVPLLSGTGVGGVCCELLALHIPVPALALHIQIAHLRVLYHQTRNIIKQKYSQTSKDIDVLK